VTYSPCLYPTSEDLHQLTYLVLNFCSHSYINPKIDQVVAAFRKVWAHLEAGE